FSFVLFSLSCVRNMTSFLFFVFSCFTHSTLSAAAAAHSSELVTHFCLTFISSDFCADRCSLCSLRIFDSENSLQYSILDLFTYFMTLLFFLIFLSLISHTSDVDIFVCHLSVSVSTYLT